MALIKGGHGRAPFQSGGGERLAQMAGVPLLAQLPLDPCVVQAGDMGSDPALIEPVGRWLGLLYAKGSRATLAEAAQVQRF